MNKLNPSSNPSDAKVINNHEEYGRVETYEGNNSSVKRARIAELNSITLIDNQSVPTHYNNLTRNQVS
jgi:hypothetical protein